MTTPQGHEGHGLPRTAGTRTTLRVLGVVLLLAGLVIGGLGLRDFIAEFDSMDGGPGSILRMAAGGFLCVVGLGALSAGTIGAQSRYAAGETMPTLKQSAAYLSDGEGIMGVGRTVDDGPHGAEGSRGSAVTGPYCRSCGVRNDEDARFCDGCGASLA
ncbi:zinc ribbon domain-containing protein [uncultured Nocardioides sp.]|uniref:zinc ribbon domain-containing protein n=1 Tax=uncultured Nocardioides sp. TaxID=198441 RepID=UPI002623E7D8|nr:zinc ribbon domain-containing protein [uncultured Nocardioides sp.]